MKILVFRISALAGFLFLDHRVAWSQNTPAAGFGVSKESVFWATFCIMTGIIVFAFGFIALGLLRSHAWQLGDALSEEADNQPNPLPAGVKPVMVASSSRLIALIGLLNILSVFLGFGYYFLYSAFAGTVHLEDMRSVIYYLFSGAVMFAPYLANQLQNAFSSFAAAPQAPARVVPIPTQPMVQPSPLMMGGVGVG
jgi:hypothetical protein